MPVREFDQNQGMAYGVGFDSVAGEVRGDCVIRTDPESPAGVSGQEVVFKIRQVTSSAELAKELNISASASLKAQFGKVSAKASYASQQNINQFSIYLVAQVSVTNPTRRMRDIKLTDEAWKLLEVKGVEEFRERCGDEFLSGITTGGEYVAVLQITTRSEEEKENVSVSVRAKGAGGTWKAGADFKYALEQISKEHEVEITSFQQGGDNSTIPDTVEEIIERAVNFPKQVEGDKAFAYSAFFQDYNTLNLPDGMNPIDVEQQKRVIEQMAQYYSSYSDLLNSIEYVFKNSDQFEAFDVAALNQKANDTRKTMNTLVESASDCFNDYRSCKLPDTLDPPIVALPARKTIEIRDAIEAAKTAANNAVAYAEDAKSAARKVVEILETISPGPSGKNLSDQARQEAENAKNFAKLARKEADNAILAKDMTEEAAEFAESAIKAADDAEQATVIAEKNSTEIYRIGYAPFWHAPSYFNLDYNPITSSAYGGIGGEFGCHFDQLPVFATDPSGGQLSLSSSAPISHVLKSTDPFDITVYMHSLQSNFFFAASESFGVISKFTFVRDISGLNSQDIQNIVKNEEFDVSLILTSLKSSLSSNIQLKIFFTEEGQEPRYKPCCTFKLRLDGMFLSTIGLVVE